MTPVLGPLAAVEIAFDRWAGREGVHLLYADLDLAERADLRRVLVAAPGTSDTDLVLAAYRRWGADAAEHLGGQFAVALWDGHRQAVVALRDGVGLRPLFWAHTPARLVVGGDLRALIAAGVSDALDEDMVAGMLLDVGFRPVSVGRTGLRAARDLRGGRRLIADARGARTARWWNPEDAPRLALRGTDAIGDALRAILREVSADAVEADPGTVGVHLSSGIDSSTVAAFAAEALSAAGAPPPTAFSWQPTPGDVPHAEHRSVRAVADRWALPVEWCHASADDHLRKDALDAVLDPITMWAPEEPVRRAAAAGGVRVMLSGWGGDEAVSFSGHGLVSPHLIRAGQWGPLVASAFRDPAYAARRLAGWRRRLAWTEKRVSLDALREAALRGDHATFARPGLLRSAVFPEPEAAPMSPRAYMAWQLRRGHLGMRASAWARAAPGIRYRYPLLDRRVLAFALGLPDQARLTHQRQRRWPLRAAGAGLVPDAVRLHSAKPEPAWIAASQRARRQAAARVAPFVTLEAAGARADIIDVTALRAALDGWLNGREPAANDQTLGLHALGLVPIIEQLESPA